MRFTITRAVSGLSRRTSHCASCRRPLSLSLMFGPLAASRSSTCRNPRGTSSPRVWGSASDVDAARLYGVTVLDAHRHVPRQRQLIEFLRQIPNLLPVLGFDGVLDLPPQLGPPELGPSRSRFRGARRSIQPHELVDLEVAGAVLGTLAQSTLQFGAAKDPGQRVIVTRRNRIELVVVTTAHPTVSPRMVREVTLIISSATSIG